MVMLSICPKCGSATEKVFVRQSFMGIRCVDRKGCKWSVPASEVDLDDEITNGGSSGEPWRGGLSAPDDDPPLVSQEEACSTSGLGRFTETTGDTAKSSGRFISEIATTDRLSVTNGFSTTRDDIGSAECSTSESNGYNGQGNGAGYGLETESVSSSPVPANGHAAGYGEPDPHQLGRWKRSLELLARSQYLKDAEFQKQHLTWDAVCDAIWGDCLQPALKLAMDGDWRNQAFKPPLGLSDTEIEEDALGAAQRAWEIFRREERNDLIVANGHYLPEVNEPEDEFADRHAVDAYEAHEVLLGQKRDYTWEGLIREGCTGVLSGLMSSGKSTLAMNIARGWALAEKVLDRECKQSKTLVVVSPKEFEAWTDTIYFWQLKGLIYVVESTKAHFGKPETTVKWFEGEMDRIGARTFVLDTMFDFFGMPPNTAGDSNRIAMNEQTPLLQLVRERNFSGLILGHAPKSEAKALDPRDPEESFGGHTAWTAQHRMRMTVRRKSQGVNAFITGKGGFGDRGILQEMLLVFDEETRLDSIGGSFAEHLGLAAMPSVVETMQAIGTAVSIAKLQKEMDKGEKWVRAGLREARKRGLVVMEGKARQTKYLLKSQQARRDSFELESSEWSDD